MVVVLNGVENLRKIGFGNVEVVGNVEVISNFDGRVLLK